MKILKFFSFVISLIILTCCNKNFGGIEPCDNCSTNIFQCKLNGKDWKSDCIPDPLFRCNSIIVEYYASDKYLGVIAVNDQINEGMHFGIHNFDLNSHSWQKFRYYDDIYSDYKLIKDCQFFSLDTSFIDNFRIINLDENKRIIKAEFQFNIFNNCNKFLEIRNGLISIKY